VFDDPRLDISSDAKDSVEWPLKFDYSSVADPGLSSPAKKLPIPCKLSLKPNKTGWIKKLPPWVNSLLMKLELQLAVRLELLRNLDDEVRRLVQQEAL
jgi:hypothetical protein